MTPEQEELTALYFACEKLCDAVLFARFYCPDEVKQTIDDAVKHWKDTQRDISESP
jgi:hypothetical protein